MNRAFAIASREFTERRFVLVISALGALIPFLSATLPYARRSGAQWVISVGGMIVSAAFTIALAVMLGSSLIGRDLSERRLSFYFSKPVSAPAIWFGKVLGAFATLLASFAIIFVPSFLLSPGVWNPGQSVTAPGFTLVVLGVAAYALLFAHVVSVMVRSRSALIALDLALLFGVVAVAAMIVRPLLLTIAWKAGAVVAGGLIVSLAIASAGAGYWQLSRGGTEVRRSHREMSKFLWSAMLVALVVAGGYTAWFLSTTPGDIAIREASASSNSDWMMVRGPAKHRMGEIATFLVNTKTQKALRFPANLWNGPSFSHNGESAISIPPLVKKFAVSDTGEVHVQDLRNPRSGTGTGIETSVRSRVAISDDQRRVAVFDTVQVLTVHDIERNALLGSVRIPHGEEGNLFFVSSDVVRVYARNWWHGKVPPDELWIYEFNVATRHLEQTGYWKTDGKPFGMRVSPDGSTMLIDTVVVTSRRSRTLMILDARTGAERARVESESRIGFSTLLANGGVAAVAYTERGESTLKIFDARGVLLREIALGGKNTGPLREIVTGKLIVTVFRSETKRDLVEIDLQKGSIDRIYADALTGPDDSRDDPRTLGPNTSGDYVMVTGTREQHELWRCNVLTGAKTKIL